VHELSLSTAIVDTVERHAEGRTVTHVNLTVGALRQVVPDSLDFYFEIVSRGTVCEGAELRQTLVEGRARCDGCGHEWTLDLPLFRCPECGDSAHPVAGEEFQVETIEVSDAREVAA
jgi:hydrogenase nickel incorporation protein HypA/HybF